MIYEDSLSEKQAPSGEHGFISTGVDFIPGLNGGDQVSCCYHNEYDRENITYSSSSAADTIGSSGLAHSGFLQQGA